MARKHGHYCKVCGEMKSNESFSGKGHAAHICKKCAKLPAPQRSEDATITRIMNLPYRLSQEQRSWLAKKRKDQRPEVAQLAQAVYAERFPHTARKEIKQRYHIRHMEFSVHATIYDAYGDGEEKQLLFTLDRDPPAILLTENGIVTRAELSSKEIRKLLAQIVTHYEVYWWEEDNPSPFYSPDIDLVDIFGIYIPEDDDEDLLVEEEPSEEQEEPTWEASILYSNGESQYLHGTHEELPLNIHELARELLSLFYPEDDEYEDDEW